MFAADDVAMSTRKRELRRRYDLTAYMYDRRYREIQQEKYEKVLANIPRADRILDLGCGTGMLLASLEKRAKFAVGVDMSAEMLGAAKKRGTKAALVLADADHLPFADGSFDAVVSVTLLQNMPNPERTVRELARVLRSNGKAIITSLKRKHSQKQLTTWVTAVGLKPLEVGEMSNGEDIICIARRD
jgi:ubiquinone/menaquinone biosynthesis C-methylase UbiE